MASRKFYVCLVIFLSFTIYPPQAQAGLMDLLFPSTKKKDPNPAETLRAPFADEDAVIEEMDATGSTKNAMPLDQRHRTNGVMTLWIQQTVPTLLTYKTDGYNNEYKEKVALFSAGGLKEYNKFLQDLNYITTLKTGRYDITGVLQNYPVVINEGSVDGRYRWLYQMDVMITYMEVGTDPYAKDPERRGQSITRNYTLTTQIGRSREAANDHGIFVETWSVKPKKE